MMYYTYTRKRIFKSAYRDVGWLFILYSKRRSGFMLGVGAIGGILIVIGTALGTIDDLTNKK